MKSRCSVQGLPATAMQLPVIASSGAGVGSCWPPQGPWLIPWARAEGRGGAVVTSQLAVSESCVGHCEDGFNAQRKCQCDALCVYYGSCCSDYASTCKLKGTCPLWSPPGPFPLTREHSQARPRLPAVAIGWLVAGRAPGCTKSQICTWQCALGQCPASIAPFRSCFGQWDVPLGGRLMLSPLH